MLGLFGALVGLMLGGLMAIPCTDSAGHWIGGLRCKQPMFWAVGGGLAFLAGVAVLSLGRRSRGESRAANREHHRLEQ